MDVRRGAVEGLGELYLLRASAGLGARGTIIDLLERHVPGRRRSSSTGPTSRARASAA
jgi:hypothetical protein